MVYVLLLKNKRICVLQVCPYKRNIRGDEIKIRLMKGRTNLMKSIISPLAKMLFA